MVFKFECPSIELMAFSGTSSSIAWVANECRAHIAGNGQIKDNEWAGIGNHYDYGERMYDPRIGRFLSIDPVALAAPGSSPYSYAGNSPIACTDNNGRFKVIVSRYAEDHGVNDITLANFNKIIKSIHLLSDLNISIF